MEFLAHSPAKVARMPQVGVEEAAAPPVVADEAPASRSRRQRRNRRKASSTLQGLETVPEPASVQEPTESAPVWEPT